MADRQTNRLCNLFRSYTTRGKGNLTQNVFCPKSTAAMRRQPVIALSKHFKGTGRIIAKPFSRNKQELNGPISDRKILNHTCIPTMRAGGNMMTGRTGRRLSVAFYR
ncbi:hypothetical protein NP92_00615 [Anoxybacillus gonensis]|nr:hypothetical protein NP92_00615 [Anoxybacillus gonensis]